jgi:hydrogenase maturation protease
VAQLLGQSPAEMVLIGVQPGSIEMDTELTPEVEAVLDTLIDSVLAEIRKIGMSYVHRDV